mmetsp:Transcript_5187/g.10283  ORF Transcript_5187/g.10283 Transcript_5187/m.10283 type:complete len:237 (-) Transcript_5187:865-1575(-)
MDELDVGFVLRFRALIDDSLKIPQSNLDVLLSNFDLSISDGFDVVFEKRRDTCHGPVHRFVTVNGAHNLGEPRWLVLLHNLHAAVSEAKLPIRHIVTRHVVQQQVAVHLMEVKVGVDGIYGFGSSIFLGHGIRQTLGGLLHRRAAHGTEILREGIHLPFVDAQGLWTRASRGHHLAPERLIPEEWGDEGRLGGLKTRIRGTSTTMMHHSSHVIKQPRMGNPSDDKGEIVSLDVVAF